MMRFLAVLAVVLAPGAAVSAELFEVSGPWVGEGLLATGAQDPMQRGRCKVSIAPSENEVSVTGRCAVAGGASEISLKAVRLGGGRVNAGFWSAATGQVVQLAGKERGAQIALTSTTDLMVDDAPFESRVTVREAEGEAFTIEQLMRPAGAEKWRMVMDMTFRAGK